MWQRVLSQGRTSRIKEAQDFLACWEITVLDGGDLRFLLRGSTLNLPVLEDLLARLASCDALAGTQFVFDLSHADEMDSCYSVICAFFVRFVALAGERCRIVGLRPGLLDVFGFFLRGVTCIEMESASSRRVRAA